MAEINYQTLSEFLEAPFGVKDAENKERLLKSYGAAKSPVFISGYTILDDTYLLHLKVPSDSKPGVNYDVVIQFFTKDGSIKTEPVLTNYYIQFFSNSPSFVYKYAVLYKQKGYMIDVLQEKLDPKYADTLPTTANKEMKLTYDKSLFFACHFLITSCKTTWLNKKYIGTRRKQSLREFLSQVTDTKGKAIFFDLSEVSRRFKKELERDIKLINPHMTLKPKTESRPTTKHKPISKIKPKLNTFNKSSFGGMTIRPVEKVKVIGKKRPKTRTTKK
nr:MAG TPA: hypothetical protein [Caudoviricetes sp.]